MTEADRIQLAIHNSSYVANCVKHVWLSHLLRLLWRYHPTIKLQIFHAEVDDCGYDIVLTVGEITRHIQLKASHAQAKTDHQDIHSELQRARGGCVVWMFYNPLTLEILKYRYFGAGPGESMPSLDRFPAARSVHRNGDGVYPERQSIRHLKRACFSIVPTLEELVAMLFGLDFPPIDANLSEANVATAPSFLDVSRP